MHPENPLPIILTGDLMSYKFQQRRLTTRPRETKSSLTCPAKANPSARSEQANQVCKQIWNAAIGVEPSREAIDADSVTQNVAAITRASNRRPEV